jgi:hypothetical protein
MKPSHGIPATTGTIGANLELDRLTWRARRVTAVIAALRQQASVKRAEAATGNRHIHQAIREFEAELASINSRLSDLAAGATPRSG